MTNAIEFEYIREIKYSYSIIIPHKNTPTLLRRCLDSIPDREDVQIIIVDDNSDTTKADFDNFPGKSRPNVEIYYTKEGKGAGYARNVGLSHAIGEWLIFADSDDYFTEEFNTILDKYKEDDSDIVFFNAESRYSDNISITADRSLNLNRYIKEHDIVSLRYHFYPPWCKLIKRDIQVKYSVLFSETIAANDVMFSVNVAYHAKRFKIEEATGYCVTLRSGSLEKTFSSAALLARVCISLETNRFYEEHNIKETCAQYYVQLCNALILCDFRTLNKGLSLCKQYGCNKLHTIVLIIYELLWNRIPIKCQWKK